MSKNRPRLPARLTRRSVASLAFAYLSVSLAAAELPPVDAEFAKLLLA